MLTPVVTPADEIARRHYERQQLLAIRTTAVAADVWSSIDSSSIASTWAVRVPGLVNTVSAMQRLAAGLSDGYVDDALAAAGTEVEASARIVPAAFAGVASDGRSLDSLLVQPAITSLRGIAAGLDVDAAMESGLAALTRIMATQVADAGRVADGVGVMTRPGVGYVRMLVPPSCSRCAVLAGRTYRASQAFQRHPRCDCRHIPVAEAAIDDLTVDSSRYFDSLSKEQQDRIFTTDGAQAVRDGADLNQVVNARRGMASAGTTTEGTTRRGFAGKRLGAKGKQSGSRFGNETKARARSTPRLMPEQIYRLADGRRDVALRLLRENGFIV